MYASNLNWSEHEVEVSQVMRAGANVQLPASEASLSVQHFIDDVSYVKRAINRV